MKYKRALALTTEFHDRGGKTFSGQFTWKMKDYIKELIDQFGVKTLLDYGCGKGKQYLNVDPRTGMDLERYWGVKSTK